MAPEPEIPAEDARAAAALAEVARFARFQMRMMVLLIALVGLAFAAQMRGKPPLVVHALVLGALACGFAMLAGAAWTGWRATVRARGQSVEGAIGEGRRRR